ncbi:hypothetical protein GGF50DRAFT_93204 [Schizophyllum commune]
MGREVTEQHDTGNKYEARNGEASVGEETGRAPTRRSRGRRGKRGRASTRKEGRCRRREMVNERADEGMWGKSGRAQHKAEARARGGHARRLFGDLDGEGATGGGGKLVTFEVDEKTAGVAKDNIAHAGLADGVEVVVGPAEKSLAAMAGAEEGRPDDALKIGHDAKGALSRMERDREQ